MANDLGGSPFKIDTAGVITTEDIKINLFVWQEPSAAGQDLTILDNGGRTLWDENSLSGGTGVSIEQEIKQDKPCRGLNVSVIDSGTLYVYFDDENMIL